MSSDGSRSVTRRVPLNDAIWQSHTGNELSALLAVMRRLLDYWETTWVDPFFICVPVDDHGLYDTLMADLLFLLERSPLDQPEADQVRSLIPNQFMDSDLAIVVDDEIGGDLRSSFAKAMSVVRRASFRLGCPCQEIDPTGLFSLFDAEIQKHLEFNIQSAIEQRNRLELRPLNLGDQLKIEVTDIEIQLRSLIDRRLEGDWSRVPDHIRVKADQRIEASIRENPTVDNTRFQSMSERLAYADLRELEQIITSKSLWSLFSEIFTNKGTLGFRFSQLAPLRNANAHMRDIDDLMRSDAKAAVIWFKGALSRGDVKNN